jgi:hypothetical protein
MLKLLNIVISCLWDLAVAFLSIESMALRREKRLNAGKALQRLDKSILSILLPSRQLKPLKKASLRSYKASIAS